MENIMDIQDICFLKDYKTLKMYPKNSDNKIWICDNLNIKNAYPLFPQIKSK